MADAYKTLYRGQLGSSNATLYTAPAGSGVVIGHISVINNDSVTRTFTLSRNGSTTAHHFAKDFELKAGESAEWDGKLALEPTGTLQGLGSAAAVLTVIIDGLEIT